MSIFLTGWLVSEGKYASRSWEKSGSARGSSLWRHTYNRINSSSKIILTIWSLLIFKRVNKLAEYIIHFFILLTTTPNININLSILDEYIMKVLIEKALILCFFGQSPKSDNDRLGHRGFDFSEFSFSRSGWSERGPWLIRNSTFFGYFFFKFFSPHGADSPFLM